MIKNENELEYIYLADLVDYLQDICITFTTLGVNPKTVGGVEKLTEILEYFSTNNNYPTLQELKYKLLEDNYKDINDKILALGNELTLDIHSFDEDCVAEICATPTQKLFNILNEIMNDNYYGDWCDCLDSIDIAITKDDHIIYVTTWANDSQINDCITISPNGSFDIVEKIMRNVEEYHE